MKQGTIMATTEGVTFEQARSAYNALLAIDSATALADPIEAFKNNLAAKYAALDLLDVLKNAATALDAIEMALAAKYTVDVEEKGEKKQVIRDAKGFMEEKRRESQKVVPGLNPAEVALKASVLGTDAIVRIPTDMLHALRPFILLDDATPDGTKNRAERRSSR